MNSSDRVYGFVYRITRDSDGKDYIGQKSFVTAKRDWPYYCSSSKTLAAEIKEHGANYIDHFTFEILFCCGDRNSLQLAETALIIEEDCIHNENNYNRSIPGQRFLAPTQHTPETRAKISRALSGEHDGSRHPHTGNTGELCFNRKDTYLGVHTKTGEVVEVTGNAAMHQAGFDPSNALKVIKGINKTHKGYRWYWRSSYKEE